MSKGRVIALKFSNREIRVNIEQARVVKKAMQEFKSGKSGDPYITINSEKDGQVFIELNAIYGIFLDKSTNYVSAEEAAI
jgi:IMP cyclohydrolase